MKAQEVIGVAAVCCGSGGGGVDKGKRRMEGKVFLGISYACELTTT